MAAKGPKAGTADNPVERGDLAVARATVPWRKHPLVRTAGELSDGGDQQPLVILSAALLGAGLLAREPRLARAGGRMLAAHLLATGVKTVLKHLIDRTRPDLIARDGRYEMGEGRRYSRDYNSFPSGHTAGSIAVARAAGREYPWVAGPALSAATAIALVQVARSSHFPTDILAGAAIGLAAEAIVDTIADELDERIA